MPRTRHHTPARGGNPTGTGRPGTAKALPQAARDQDSRGYTARKEGPVKVRQLLPAVLPRKDLAFSVLTTRLTLAKTFGSLGELVDRPTLVEGIRSGTDVVAQVRSYRERNQSGWRAGAGRQAQEPNGEGHARCR